MGSNAEPRLRAATPDPVPTAVERLVGHPDTVPALTHGRAVFRSAAVAARRAAPRAAPLAAAAYAAAALVLYAALLVLPAAHAATDRGTPRFAPELTLPVLGLLVLTALPAALWALGFVIVVAAGAAAGRQIPLDGAARTALRRLPSAAFLVVLFAAAVLVAGWLAGLADNLVDSRIVLAILAVVPAMLLALALPAAVLDGAGPLAALRAARAAGWGQRIRALPAVGLWVLTGGGLMWLALSLPTGWVGNPAARVGYAVAALAATVATMLLIGALLAVLRLRPVADPAPGRENAATNLLQLGETQPGPAPRGRLGRIPPAAVGAAALLLVVAVNVAPVRPAGAVTWTARTPLDPPTKRVSIGVQLHLLPVDRGVLAVAADRSSTIEAWWCGGSPCRFGRRESITGNPSSDLISNRVVHRAADTLISARRQVDGAVELVRCAAAGCTRVGTANPAGGGGTKRDLIAVAADGADLVLLWSVPVSQGAREELHLTRCPVAACDAGAVTTLVTDRTGPIIDRRDIAVELRDGLPIIAWRQGTELVIQFCADPGCTRSGVRTTVPGIRQSRVTISMRLLAGGRPGVLAGTTLVTCDDPDCNGHSRAVLAGGGTAALSVDRAGRPLVATSDSPGAVRLHFCSDVSCRNRRSQFIGHQPATRYYYDRLAVAVTADGVPVVGWLLDDAVVVTGCERPDCW